ETAVPEVVALHAVLREELVVAGPAVQPVVALAAVEGVGEWASGEEVVAAPAVDLVALGRMVAARLDQVVPATAVDRVAAEAAEDDVVPSAAVDRVAARR